MNAPSPEVASLGTFGAVPVGHYTGTSSISIPLYTMEVGKLKIPIQAMYHTSNVKPHTPPTCLGIGWVLSAGGYIARNVKGNQDEKVTLTDDGKSLNKAGYYFNHDKIKMLDNKSKTLNDLTKLKGDGWYELSADEFSFSFNGYSGTFFMDKDGQWRVVSDDNIMVEFDEVNGFKTGEEIINRLNSRLSMQFKKKKNKNNLRFFDKFTLIAPDGTRYEFGGDNATEYSIPYYNQVDGDIMATCWRLSKITTIDGRVVNFEYAADSYMCDIHYAPQWVITKSDNYYNHQHNFGRNGYSGFLSMPSRLLKISTEDENVEFKYERDNGYGKMFDADTQCLYWTENETRYSYERSYLYDTNKFCYCLGVSPSTEYETRKKIAEKITQDYLTNITVKKPLGKFLDIEFGLTRVQGRRLLSGITFRTKGDGRIGEKDNFINSIKSIRFSEDETDFADEEEEAEDPEYPVDPIMPEEPVEPEEPDEPVKQDDLINFPIGDDDIELPKKPAKEIKVYKYEFDYYSDNKNDDLWPSRSPLTYTDSWGYYSRGGSNPKNAGEWQLAKGYSREDFKIRPASLYSTKYFVLKSIKYPTGGRTDFEYELNDYSKIFSLENNSVDQTSGTAGGLRVKTIKNYNDANGSKLLYSKNYIYKTDLNGKSSGILKSVPCFHNCTYLNSKKTDYVDFYSFDEINPYPLNFNTPNVGYSTVFEELRDHDGTLLTRTKYQYTNYDTDINGKSHKDIPAECTWNVFDSYPTAAFTSMSFERGKLTSKEVMNGSNKVLEKTTYDYVRSVGEPFTTVSRECYKYSGDPIGLSYLYKTYANRYLVSVEKRKETMENGTFCVENKYSYGKHGLLREKATISNSISRFCKWYYYTIDSLNYAGHVISYPWMKEKNIILPCIEAESGAFGGDHETRYTYSESISGAPYISQKQSSWSFRYSNRPMKKRIDYTVEKADMYGNPVVMEEQGIKTIMIWGYKGQRLIATIQNATYDEVKDALGMAPEECSDADMGYFGFSELLRTELPNAFIYTYDYDSELNLIRKTDSNGLSHTFNYDGLGRLTDVYRKIGDEPELLKSYKYKYKTGE
ncbi:MAG: RHS repeat protein [Bacteroidaceae bacterium]|nr:RHS repeat protein [Bacteroidaceae bacterium]